METDKRRWSHRETVIRVILVIVALMLLAGWLRVHIVVT